MSNFINELKGIMSDSKFGSQNESLHIRTGINMFDYLNGSAIPTKDGGRLFNLGLGSGKQVMVIGKSGSGKSTLALQIATNIIKRYDQASLFIMDFEQSHTKERIRMISGLSDEEYDQKVTLKQTGISTETVLRIAAQIKELKLKYKKELLTNNLEGHLDDDGKVKKILPPTVLLIDSIATMLPEKISDDEGEISGQMLATQSAKMNTQLVKRLTQLCSEANIIVIYINHINQKVDTGMMPTQASINYLKQDETLSGGLAIQYLTDTLIKITTSSKLDETKTYMIKGFEAKVELIKSRTAAAGRSVTMIYNQMEGFDDELSMLEFVKSNGMLKGSPVAYYIEGLDTVKFRFSNFKQVIAENKDLRDHFYNVAETLLKDSLKSSSKLMVSESTTDTDEVVEDVAGN
jgi:RecA/RadA recombinase